MSGNWGWHPERAPETDNGRFACEGIYGCTKTVKKEGTACLACKRKMKKEEK